MGYTFLIGSSHMPMFLNMKMGVGTNKGPNEIIVEKGCEFF